MQSVLGKAKQILSNAIFLLSLCPALFSQAQDSASVMKPPIELLRTAEKNEVLVLYLTGDGGWNKFSQDIGASFVKKGYSVVALNSPVACNNIPFSEA
ncbi:MAG: hypothetical protein OEW40_12220 [Cyclobacteriaceae bacterium]|nr:hypothetical protein [Cyclobacteriaceae bacterium]